MKRWLIMGVLMLFSFLGLFAIYENKDSEGNLLGAFLLGILTALMMGLIIVLSVSHPF